MDIPVRFAIVGCGVIGTKRFKALPPGSLVATCDVISSRAAELAAAAGTQCRPTDNLDDLLAAAPDGVIVATLNASLAPIAAACIRAGKDVLIEKPVAISLKEIDELSSLARQTGVLVRAGYNHRYHPAI